MVFLYVLALNGALVGLCLGVLLPTLFPGVCFGVSLALFVGAIATIANAYYFPITAGSMAVLFGLASAK